MTESRLRKMAAGLGDSALEALASRGLVRRAHADASKVEIVREDDTSVECIADGETVCITAEGMAKASCSCPAVGMCRHRLAVVIFLRGAPAQDGAEASAPPAANIDWKKIFENISVESIARFAGKTGWHDIQERAPAAATIENSGDTLVVYSADALHPVAFLAMGGLPAAITKVPAKLRKVTIAAAAIDVRRSFGLPEVLAEPAAGERSTAQADEPATAKFNTAGTVEVRALLERVYASSFSMASAAIEDEARRLALAGRVEAMPRLASLLRRIAAEAAALRHRTADADGEALLTLVADTYALCVALENATEESRERLAGVTRREYADIGDLEMFGLGARLWETPGGAHGVTAHFFAPEPKQLFTLGLARPDRKDVQFHPATAFQRTPVWTEPMPRLCVSRVTLTGAQAAAGGRLSTSNATRATTDTWTPTREAVAQWPCAFDNWAALEAHMQERMSPRLGGELTRDTAVILLLSRHAPARFDEITQTLTWPVADAAGRWIGLSLSYEDVERARIAALERATSSGRFWAVLAIAERDGGEITLRPYALWGTRQILLDFDPDAKGGDRETLLERLRRFVARTGPMPVATAGAASVTGALLDRAWNMLLRRAEAGPSVAAGTFASEAGELLKIIEAAGLTAVARQLVDLAVPNRGSAGACVRAAYAVSTARLAKSRIQWMR